MASQDINLEFNTFVGGILTEANPINFPAGFSLDQENFLQDLNGSNRRRWGLDFDSTPTTYDSLTAEDILIESSEVFVWPGARGASSDKVQDLLVIFKEDRYSTYEITESGDISANPLAIFQPLNELTNDGRYIYKLYKGNLLISDKVGYEIKLNDGTPLATIASAGVREYSMDADTGTLTFIRNHTLQVRDFEGLPDGLQDNETPGATRGNNYTYNMYNQGWNFTNLQQYRTDVTVYPSKADNMNTGLDPLTGAFTSAWVQNANNGYRRVTGGRTIVAPSAPDNYRIKVRRDEEGSGTIDSLSGFNNAYIVDMTEFSGRMYYIHKDGKLNNNDTHSVGGSTQLLYSQLGTGLDIVSKCYSINDPTSRDFNQPLPTDGGAIDLSDLGDVYRLVALKTRLIILASTGVYELFYGLEVADVNNFVIRKISEVLPANMRISNGTRYYCTNPVVVEDSLFFLSTGGVYLVSSSERENESFVSNITDETIQKVVRGFNQDALGTARGVFSSEDRSIRWLISGDDTIEQDSGNSGNLKDVELVYNIALKSWTKNRYVKRKESGSITPLGLTNVVELPSKVATATDYPIGSRLRYIGISRTPDLAPTTDPTVAIMKPQEDTFFDYIKDSELDGGKGYDYTAFIQTGFISGGDSQRRKQSMYIVPSFVRTEDGFTEVDGDLIPNNESSCIISAWWDYVDDPSNAKRNPPFEAYRYNRYYQPEDASDPYSYGQSVLTTKNKLTGRGRALSLRFESTSGKDCQLLGWGMMLSVGTQV